LQHLDQDHVHLGREVLLDAVEQQARVRVQRERAQERLGRLAERA